MTKVSTVYFAFKYTWYYEELHIGYIMIALWETPMPPRRGAERSKRRRAFLGEAALFEPEGRGGPGRRRIATSFGEDPAGRPGWAHAKGARLPRRG